MRQTFLYAVTVAVLVGCGLVYVLDNIPIAVFVGTVTGAGATVRGIVVWG